MPATIFSSLQSKSHRNKKARILGLYLKPLFISKPNDFQCEPKHQYPAHWASFYPNRALPNRLPKQIFRPRVILSPPSQSSHSATTSSAVVVQPNSPPSFFRRVQLISRDPNPLVYGKLLLQVYRFKRLRMPSFFLEYIKKRNLEKKRKRRHGKRRQTKRKLEGKWSTLPEDLIQLIAKKLSLTDHFSASKVCKRWNAALREDDPSWQGRGFPCLFVSGELHNPNKSVISILDNLDWKFYEPGASRFYCWGSYLEWLIMVNHVKINLEVEFGNIMFWNPFTRKQVTLPSISFPYHKIVLSGPPSEDGFVCMLLQHHMKDRKLAFYKAGAQSWLEFRLKGEPFEDALFFNGSFYLLDGSCNIWQIDVEGICSVISEDGLSELQMQLHEIDMSDMQPINDRPPDEILRYLVESCGEILLVCRYIRHFLLTVKFEVYSLDLALSSWIKVEDLKDQMLFLGRSCSYSLSAEELGAGIRNSIYFTNDRDRPWYRDNYWYNPVNEWDMDWKFEGMVYVSIKAERNAPGIWGNFEVGNDYGNSFTFGGDLDKWPYTWFIAPIWWYCKKASYANFSNKWHRY